LKKQYFNREERSLDEILKGKPQKVNELQWKALVGFWCRDQHKVTSYYVKFKSNLKVMSVTMFYNSCLCRNYVRQTLESQNNRRIHTHQGEKAMLGLKKRWCIFIQCYLLYSL
jgi:hypothetical protein